ncbi:MAG: HdeD family acid-resistance protein [Acidobacteriaceae bacterium]|nr:HdeD family acid-resistance protein [Acidobacteriaceae bacterium]MBV9033352.1 HdeD family acid-resistance protein [Acidobacteriaceae bacterium]MBV9224384.1 HdeD family acid-resistance protein [Acidobacteriaceae bacterium]MBV9676270.1 HdeD family acid-resistance protein [Acidobacteriaceae bacterium]
MAVVLRANWWALVLRGIVAILLAVVTFIVPHITVAVLATIFGFYALFDGVLAIVSTIKAVQGHRRWGAFLLEGVIGILVGLYAILFPLATAAIFVTIMAFWAVVTGILEISAAIRLRRHIQGEWLLILSGVLSILLGITLFAQPFAGVLFFVWVLAGYGLIFGVLLIALGFRVRRLPAQSLPSASGVGV